MRISRLFIPHPLNVGQQIGLQEHSAHYVRTVLRLKKENAITLFNGQGGEYLCTITEVSRKRVVINIKQAIDRSVESPLSITLGLGISRGDRMDWAVQKSVELGVNNITPLMTERCVVKFKENKQKQKLQHWKNIVQHATEQCNRTVLPIVHEIDALKNWVDRQNGLKVFLDPQAEQSLVELTPVDQHVTLLSGPEGGFSDQERDIAVAAGFISVRLGNRVLRTETVTLAALSAVQMLWGDFL
ncbi:MAG: 16S rRNA (uracil(1498)-N(3))-methyltransferase [Methylococcales symbiont of Iophon sp. n. MRB-2018]|nr:MAG: 16S rRNA (uracil(1498)-N(3))-methyltransferase [Methylococcales symbiont of Iophon sp. n. MRB-2018]KAF3980443.1 MAG: 16S rRNA (uracil(1498)-N(3))-methyltransferase [Methylococcales symbiont of Iophon sp. n. MRB-2018]